MEITDIIRSDEELEAIDNGVWVDDIEGAPGVSLLVIGLRSKEVEKLLEKKQEAIRLKGRGKALTANQLTRCLRETLAEVVLKGWKGFTQDGKPLEFNPELAKKWLLSRNGDRFAEMVLAAAQLVDADVSEFIETTSKN